MRNYIEIFQVVFVLCSFLYIDILLKDVEDGEDAVDDPLGALRLPFAMRRVRGGDG